MTVTEETAPAETSVEVEETEPAETDPADTEEPETEPAETEADTTETDPGETTTEETDTGETTTEADSGETTTQPATVVDAAAEAGTFETLVASLERSGLDATLAGDGPFTLFAPTDDAFDALPEELVSATRGRGLWLALDVSDAVAEYARLSAAGVKAAWPLEVTADGTRRFAVRDPNGILVIITQRTRVRQADEQGARMSEEVPLAG